MGKKSITKYEGKFESGQIFGKWLIISHEILIDKEAKVLCKCTECNITEKYVPALQLVNGVSKRCSVCGYSNKMEKNPSWKGFREIPFSWFSKYFLRKGGKRDGNITIEDVYNIWIKQNKKCNLSGVDIDFIKRKNGISASIDRIDSKYEYTLDNVQIVHKDVNLMKNKFEIEYFLNLCKQITNKNEKI